MPQAVVNMPTSNIEIDLIEVEVSCMEVIEKDQGEIVRRAVLLVTKLLSLILLFMLKRVRLALTSRAFTKTTKYLLKAQNP